MLTCEGTTLKWIDNSMMLADSLTTENADAEYLMSSVEKNHWSEELTVQAAKVKERIKEGRHLRAEAAREVKKLAKSTAV